MTDKRYYDEQDDITKYWELRHQAWLENPDWANYPRMQAWFNQRFDHLLPPRQDEVIGGRGPIGRVLDYGCGAGLYALPLVERFAHYTGFDTSMSAIGAAIAYYGRLGPRTRNRMSFNFFTGKPGNWEPNVQNWYDLVISITVLQHQPVPIRLAMVENIKRLLRPGGMYIGLEWSDNSSQAYDMPPIDEQQWRDAWLPLVIERDVPAGHPEWRADNVWVAK